MDADPAAMGFSFAGQTFTALPAGRFLAGGGGVRCGMGDERCFLIESREQVTTYLSKGRADVEPKGARWPRSSVLLDWVTALRYVPPLAFLSAQAAHGARRGRRLAQRAARDDAGLRARRSNARGARGTAARGLPGGARRAGWCAALLR